MKIGCTTIGGPIPNATCSFPFVYNGTSYTRCIRENSDPNSYFCPTRVDEYGTRIAEEWGYCGSNCIPLSM